VKHNFYILLHACRMKTAMPGTAFSGCTTFFGRPWWKTQDSKAVREGNTERYTFKVMCFARHSKVVEFEIIFINHSFITSCSVMMSQIDWTACEKSSHIPLPPGLLVNNEALRPCQRGRSARLLVCSIRHTILGSCQPLVSKWSDQMGF